MLANLSVAAAHARDGDRAFALALDARRKLADARDFVPRGEDAEHASFAARLAEAHAKLGDFEEAVEDAATHLADRDTIIHHNAAIYVHVFFHMFIHFRISSYFYRW